MVQYYWTEPPWFTIFRQRTFCGLALQGKTIQGSVWSDRTFSVHHFWKKNVLWFSIIRQNLLGSGFLDTEPFVVQHYRTKSFMVQDYQLEPFRVLVLLYRTIKQFCTCCRTQNSSAKLHFFSEYKHLKIQTSRYRLAMDRS